jgi:hypothetical protein
MLFLTNFTAIVISADIVFFLAGFRPHRRLREGDYSTLLRYRVLAAGATLAVLSVPLVRTLGRASEQAWARKEAMRILAPALDEAGRRALGGVEVRVEHDLVAVQASVRTVRFIQDGDVERLEHALSSRIGRAVKLDLQQIQFARPEPVDAAPRPRDFVAGGMVRGGAAAATDLHVGTLVSALEDRVQSSVAFLTKGQEEQRVLVKAIATQPAGGLRLELSCERAGPSDAQYWNLLAASLAKDLGASVLLHATVSSRLADADTIRFRQRSARALPADMARLTSALKRQSGETNAKIAFVPSESAPAGLASERLALLGDRFKNGVIELHGFPGPTDADSIAVYLVQQISSAADPPEEASLPH